MSLYGDDYLTNPDYKAFARSGGGGGRGAVGGGGGFAPVGGTGGGGLAGSLNLTNGGNESALKALLRSRMRLPSQATGGPSYMAPGASKFDTGGFAGTGMTMQPNIVGRPNPTPNPVQPAGGGSGSWTQPGANPSGDPTIVATPWSGSGWDQSRELNQVYQLLNQFAQSGAFGGTGSSGLMDMQRSSAISDANALRQRNRLASQSLGVDPATAASYALQSDLNTQGNASDAVSKSALEQLLGQQGFAQSLLGAVTGQNFADWNARRDNQWNRDNGVYNQGGGGGGWGEFLGSAAGSFLGPWGTAAGGYAGRKLSGGR